MSEEKTIKGSTRRQYRYDSKNCVRIGIKLNVKTDAPILAKLSEVPSMSGYIRSLIFEDIRENDPGLLNIERFEKDGASMSLGKPTPPVSDTYSPDT